MTSKPTTSMRKLSELLDPKFMARLDALDVLSRKILQGKLQGERRLAQFTADVESQKKTLELSQTKLERDKKQLLATKIYAPQDGLVVYGASGGGHFSNESMIEEGAVVRRELDAAPSTNPAAGSNSRRRQKPATRNGIRYPARLAPTPGKPRGSAKPGSTHRSPGQNVGARLRLQGDGQAYPLPDSHRTDQAGRHQLQCVRGEILSFHRDRGQTRND